MVGASSQSQQSASCGHREPSAVGCGRQRRRRWLTRCRQDMRCIHMRTERFERLHDHAVLIAVVRADQERKAERALGAEVAG
jgi:hypothetical protein